MHSEVVISNANIAIYTSKVVEKLKWVSQRNKGKLPYTILKNGQYNDLDYIDPTNDDLGVSWWTNGFFGGILWQMYHHTGESIYAGYALEQEKLLDVCFDIFSGIHHDVGFMWLHTAVANYKKTGDKKARSRALHAATILAGRFNVNGNYIRAWNFPEDKMKGFTIIDSMMNISLLFWASRETGDPRFESIARLHADTVMDQFIRDDGTSYHIVEFDASTGERIQAHGGQGVSQESSWTRGQAWALYGFTNTYKSTRDKKYLATAIKVANRFIESAKERHYIIPIDFDQDNDDSREDNSAACIAASGLLELAMQLEGVESVKYKAEASNILERVCGERLTLDVSKESLVAECSVAYHFDTDISTLIYADYFLLEALLKYEKNHLDMW